jgi:hypothetical protein
MSSDARTGVKPRDRGCFLGPSARVHLPRRLVEALNPDLSLCRRSQVQLIVRQVSTPACVHFYWNSTILAL